MNPFSLSDKRILVIGASSGIGKATAIACAEMGASVIAVGRNAERLHHCYENLAGDGHMQSICDVTSDCEVQSLAESVGKVDGLVYCAGSLLTVPTRFISKEPLQSMFDTNYFSAALLVSRFLQSRCIAKGASLVLVSSAAANGAVEPGNAIYSSSKAALQAYAKVLALELASKKIRVNCIAPGMVETPFVKNFEADDDQLAINANKYPLGFGRPEDIAYAAVYLLSDAARWATGTVMNLDGGLSLH